MGISVTRKSSNVNLNLIAGNHTFRLSQIGPGYVILREAVSIDPCDAEIVVSVDGDDRRIPVQLVDGAVPSNRNVRVMHCVDGPDEDISSGQTKSFKTVDGMLDSLKQTW